MSKEDFITLMFFFGSIFSGVAGNHGMCIMFAMCICTHDICNAIKEKKQ